MKPYRNIKIVVIFAILMLLSCDVTLLFAAQNDSDANSSTQQQLQQIQALQAQNTPTSSQAQGAPTADQISPPTTLSQGLIPTPSAAMPPPAEVQPQPQAQVQPVPQQIQPQPQVQAQQALPPVDQNAAAANYAPPQQTQPVDQNQEAQPIAPTNEENNYVNNQGAGFNTQNAPAATTPTQTYNNVTQPYNQYAGQPQGNVIVSQPPPNPGAAMAGAENNGMIPEDTVRDQAFDAMAQNQLPMSPEQIQRLRSLFDQSQYAAATMPGIPPRPTVTSQFVNLSPGSTAPVIRLAQGFVTSLVFIDSTGAPWPIAAYDIGNPSAFNIQWNHSDNTLMIQSLTLYTYGNLAVRLQGLPTPVMLTLIPGQRAVDYRVDLRIQGNGPNALPIPVVGLPGSANPELLGVLDGIPPDGSSEIQIEGGCAQAWVRGNQLFVRTHYTILSPGWTATMSSADGMKAYQMPKAPLLLAAANGKIIQLKLEGF